MKWIGGRSVSLVLDLRHQPVGSRFSSSASIMLVIIRYNFIFNPSIEFFETFGLSRYGARENYDCLDSRHLQKGVV